jgi:hypothetical protein
VSTRKGSSVTCWAAGDRIADRLPDLLSRAAAGDTLRHGRRSQAPQKPEVVRQGAVPPGQPSERASPRGGESWDSIPVLRRSDDGPDRGWRWRAGQRGRLRAAARSSDTLLAGAEGRGGGRQRTGFGTGDYAGRGWKRLGSESNGIPRPGGFPDAWTQACVAATRPQGTVCKWIRFPGLGWGVQRVLIMPDIKILNFD